MFLYFISVQIRMKKAITISAILVIFIAIIIAKFGNFKFVIPSKEQEKPVFEMKINDAVLCFHLKLYVD